MSAPKKKRHVARSPEDLAAKRNLILDAATSLLVEKGYAKTTISDVAERAGIGRGTVYWHFESKDDLFYDLMAREVDNMDAALGPLLEQPGPALAKVDAIVRLTFGYYGEFGPMFQALLSILGGAGETLKGRLLAFMTEMYSQYDRLLADLLEQGKEEGAVRPDLDSQVTAAAIVAMLDAMYLQVEFGQIPNDPDRLTAAVMNLIHHGTMPSGKDHA